MALIVAVGRRLHDLGTMVLPGGLTVYATILVALENSRTDEAILRHVEELAPHFGSRLLLVHVADGWVARHLDHLNLAESAEMREDRAYLEPVRRALHRRAASRPRPSCCAASRPTPSRASTAERGRST